MLRFRPIPASAPAALAALAFLCAAALYAEDPSPTLDFVVTASRTPEAASEASTLVTTVTAEEIAATSSANVVEALQNTLGVTFKSYSGDAQAEVSMRGFGENSFGRVLVLVDGKRLNNLDMASLNWLSVPVENIERIEVLHGSASVLYGGGAVGGVINIITRKPENGIKTAIGLSVGQNWENGQNFDLEMGSEKSSLVSTVSRFTTEGYRDRSEYASTLGTIAGTHKLSDTLNLKLGGTYSDVNYEMPGYLTKAQYDADPTQATNKSDEGEIRNLDADAALEWFPADNLAVQLPFNYRYSLRNSDTASYSSWTDTAENRVEARPQLTWETKLAERDLRIISGADFHFGSLGADVYSDSYRTTESNEFSIDQWEVGPFATIHYALTKALALDGGLRWDASSISGENIDGTADGDKFRSALVYDAGLNWNAARNLSFFLRLATTFRYPFTDEQTAYYGYGYDSFNKDLEPEQGRDIELGGSFQYHKVVRVQAQAWYLDMTDEIAYNSATSTNENMDGTRRLGADLAVNVRPISFISLDANYSWVDARFSTGDNDGNLVPLVSAHSVNASATVTLPVHVSFGPTFSYRSAQYAGGDYANTQDTIDGYVLLGGLLTITPKIDRGELSISARLDNLLGTDYATAAYYSSYSGVTGYYPGEGRTFRLSVRYRH